ncbi:hypothetical protein FAZ69_19585 [Trinickia terrae]|uniref:Uncharacterized protein n=1 Tax=Trinickia terrae TaxID=2571161 RepID=A0A4U1I119_9BURK|nr:hypothetical protein [Trinickia terrae]TKC86844.1 hypothetical protein FAZ69_19585 [Trinickia terrae]
MKSRQRKIRSVAIRFGLSFLSLVSATSSNATDGVGEETQVAIVVGYHDRNLASLHQLEDELDAVARAAHTGELDGDEVALDGSQVSIYMTARQVDLLIKTIRPVLKAHEFSRNARIIPGG